MTPPRLRIRGAAAAGALIAALLIPLLGPSTAAAAPTRYEAESAVVSQGVVEANHAGFSGTGFVNGDNVAGAYVEFTVTAPAAGTASLAIRYANGTTADRPGELSINGVSAGAQSFPSTGTWTGWTTKTVGASLTAGSNTVRLTATTAGGLPNLDFLDVDIAAAGADYQAEDAVISQGVVASNHAGFTGTGFVDYTNITGSYVEFTVNAPAAGSTGLQFRYANGSTGDRPVDVYVNGTKVAAAVSFPQTGAWTSWTTKTVNAALTAGSNTVRATATTAGGGPNLDKLALTAPVDPPTGDTPAEINGQLRMCGTKLCNDSGNPIQLRGMSSHGLQWYSQCLTTGSLNALADDWNSDVLRISMYIQEGGYETDPRLYTDRVHSLIEQATARGMYAIVDWHMLSPGDPYYNLSRAKTFFTEIAQRHNAKTNLLYEIANEPSGVSWSRIKSYAEELIPVIRANDPETPVLVGTRAWSSLGVSDGASETEVVDNPVNATNIAYTFHFYAASHGSEYLGALSRAADRIPVFVTEFGTQTASGDGTNNFTRSQEYLDLMASKKISWVNWNYSDDSRSGAVFKPGTCDANGPWTGTTPLKAAGVWVRDRIRTPDSFPTG